MKLNISHHCLAGSSLITFWMQTRIITKDFRSTYVFSVKKADNSANFTADGTISRRAHHTSICRDKNKH
jgi:hypothetical protein